MLLNPRHRKDIQHDAHATNENEGLQVLPFWARVGLTGIASVEHKFLAFGSKIVEDVPLASVIALTILREER